MSEQVSTSVEPVELPAGERRDLLGLVEEVQAEKRAETRRLKLDPDSIPHLLLPYQARWHADRATVRLGEKSRRIGWSWGCYAAEGALEAAMTRGMDQLYMGTNYAMAAENIGDVAFWARAYQLASDYAIDVRKEMHQREVREGGKVIANERRDVLRYVIRFASGHKYEALSAAPYNWRGRQGHARIDEAAFMPDLAEVLKGALAYRLWGGRISICSTHDGEDNPFNLYVKEIRAGKLPWSHHRVSFDDALADGFYRRVCLVRGIEWSAEGERRYRDDAYADYPEQAAADEELGCIARAGSGAYFSRLLYEQCQAEGIPVLCWSRPAEFVTDERRLAVTAEWIAEVLAPVVAQLPPARSVYGQDFGRSGDLSVIWVLQQVRPAQWRTAFVLEQRNLPFDVQAAIRDYLLDELPLLQAAKFDARGNGQSHAEGALQKKGAAVVECVMMSANWYAEHFPPYRRAFEDRAIEVPVSEDLIADHRRVVLKRGIPAMDDKRDKGSDGGWRHGDGAVAGVLAWAGTLVPPEHFAYRPVPRASTIDPLREDDDDLVYRPRLHAGLGSRRGIW